MAPGVLCNYLKTGKENCLYSFLKYVTDQLATATYPPPLNDPNVYEGSYNQTMKFPCVTIQDVGFPCLGERAIGRYGGNDKCFREERTILEINVYDQDRPEDNYVTATLQVRRLRDLIRYITLTPGLVNYDSQGTPTNLLGGMPLLDHQDSDADTGSFLWVPIEEPAHFNETFFEAQADQPSMKRYRILLRLGWIWYVGDEDFKKYVLDSLGNFVRDGSGNLVYTV
jgi:hypothetical protein